MLDVNPNLKAPVPENNTGVRRLINAARFSMQGLRACFRTEEAFRQEVYASIVLIPLGFYLGDTPIERALLVSAVLFVMIVELLNTAVERAIDRISFERHNLSKESKDMGSAAVLLAIAIAAVIWGCILL
ncbi:MAG: diacylglycerol kinase [Pseudobdellovibrionaceae bacterium]